MANADDGRGPGYPRRAKSAWPTILAALANLLFWIYLATSNSCDQVRGVRLEITCEPLDGRPLRELSFQVVRDLLGSGSGNSSAILSVLEQRDDQESVVIGRVPCSSDDPIDEKWFEGAKVTLIASSASHGTVCQVITTLEPRIRFPAPATLEVRFERPPSTTEGVEYRIEVEGRSADRTGAEHMVGLSGDSQNDVVRFPAIAPGRYTVSLRRWRVRSLPNGQTWRTSAGIRREKGATQGVGWIDVELHSGPNVVTIP